MIGIHYFVAKKPKGKRTEAHQLVATLASVQVMSPTGQAVHKLAKKERKKPQ